ncbi:MAG: hypothetical protein CMD08_01540 [Flavobacteriales bacterium]|nr:hypothetical protein [Flavobacteriales bacterium]
MIKLEKIYFDGKGYAKSLADQNIECSQEEVDIANKFNFAPIDSISFEYYQPQTYCDITLGDHHLKAVSIEHLYTDISRQVRTVLYPSHNPGDLY